MASHTAVLGTDSRSRRSMKRSMFISLTEGGAREVRNMYSHAICRPDTINAQHHVVAHLVKGRGMCCKRLSPNP
jgi:hypothetical protein